MSTSTTQQFDGSTIEEALGAAVATMGDDLEIIDAQKVMRRRRFGVRRTESFEVVAAPRVASDAEFDSVLARMVEAVDEKERAVVDLTTPRRGAGGGVDLADSDMDWWADAELVVPAPGTATPAPQPTSPEPVAAAAAVTTPTHQSMADIEFTPALDADEVDVRDDQIIDLNELDSPAAQPPGPTITPDSVAATVGPDIGVAPTTVMEPSRPEPTVEVVGPAPAHAAPPAHAAVAPAPAEPKSFDTSWSLDALAQLGIPPLVFEQIRPLGPVTDFEWVAAITSVLEGLQSRIDASGSTVELTGYGTEAAIELINGICRGLRAGHLVIDGVRLDATPFELALSVRSCLQR